MGPNPQPSGIDAHPSADRQSAPVASRRYAAFISYSHSDEKTAAWIHRRLEAYRIPDNVAPGVGVKGLFGRRIGKVFRDRAEFAAGGALIDEVKAALRQSEHLIVLCSPKAAASRYVEAEIEYYASLGGAGRIIPVIVEGDPPACFPAALHSGPERLGADLRTDKDGRDAGSLKVLAGLLGVGQDDLFRRERRRQRKMVFLLAGVAAAFAGIAVFAAIQTVAERRERLRAEDALGKLFVQRASDPTLHPAARARYALAGVELFPDNAEALGLALRTTLQEQDRLLQTFENSGAHARFTSGGIVLRKADGSVAEWDAETGARKRQLFASSKEIRDIVWGARERLAVAEADGAVHLLEGAKRQERWVQRVNVGTLWSLAMSPDGERLGIAGEAGTAEIRDARTGQLVFTLKPDRLALYKIAFANSGAFIATASHTGEAQIWDARTGALLHRLAGHAQRLRDLVFLGDGSRLATASMDGTIRLWDAASGASLRTLEGHKNWVDDLATDQGGKLLISGSSDGTAKVWDTGTGALKTTLPGFDGPVYGVAMSADGRHVAAGSADGTALLADMAEGGESVRLRAHEGGPVYQVGFSSDGNRLVTEGATSTARVWSVAASVPDSGVPAGGLEQKTVRSKMDRGELFVDDAGTIQILDARTQHVIRTLAGHKSKVNHVAVSKDGSLVATASLDNTAIIWKRSSGVPVTILRGHLFPLELVALSPDGRFATTASRDETVRLWDVASGRELFKWPTQTRWMDALGFSENGQMVLGTGEGRSFAWDISRLIWDMPRATQFACHRLLSPIQWSFTEDERRNDPLVREVWLPRRQNRAQTVCGA